MASLAIAAPILPGKAEDFRRFAKEAVVTRRKEYEEYRRRYSLTKELAWIQQTPMGDMLIVLLEADDPVRANQAFAASKDPYDLWFKQQVGAITGIDFNQPIPVIPELTAFDG